MVCLWFGGCGVYDLFTVCFLGEGLWFVYGLGHHVYDLFYVWGYVYGLFMVYGWFMVGVHGSPDEKDRNRIWRQVKERGEKEIEREGKDNR